mmetsp:Transcript_85082/g.194013  ORF Transcript_85082/g.194013 Transcript_85082/m.194013 type:complete len:86 (+) Transcript_85082:1333-1590(+)
MQFFEHLGDLAIHVTLIGVLQREVCNPDSTGWCNVAMWQRCLCPGFCFRQLLQAVSRAKRRSYAVIMYHSWCRLLSASMSIPPVQ